MIVYKECLGSKPPYTLRNSLADLGILFFQWRKIIKIKSVLRILFPRQITNKFPGHRVALWAFYFLTALTLWRSQHHLFAADGGAQSIASIPLDAYSANAASTIIGMFALWGLSQLVIGLVYLIAAIRYRALIPMLYLLSLVEYLMRALYMPAHKQIETVGTAPGAVGNLPLIIYSLVMLVFSLWPKIIGKGQSHQPGVS
ncbi:MAG: hypothetical protein R6U51_07470 [Anaerolineales bacterium]